MGSLQKTSSMYWMIYLFYFFIITLFHISQSVQYYVDSQNTNTDGDGSDWNNAFIHLSDALSNAINGDEIWLKGGDSRIYQPSQDSSRDSCFFVNEGVSIYGGFDGTELSINDRIQPFTTFESIISGEIRDPSTNQDNCYHVLTYNKTILLNGITISDGYANLNPNTRNDQLPTLLHGYGAAMITNNGLDSQQVFISNVIFANNVAFNGGALWFGASNSNDVAVTISNSLFIQNAAINGILIFVYVDIMSFVSNKI